MKRIALLLALSVCTVGCGPPFDPVNFLDGLRLLAVRAEPAEPALGEMVKLTVLGLDTMGEDIHYDWYRCQGLTVAQCGPIEPGGDGGEALELVGSGASITIQFQFAFSRALLGTLDATDGIYQPFKVIARAPDPTTAQSAGAADYAAYPAAGRLAHHLALAFGSAHAPRHCVIPDDESPVNAN